MIFTKICLDDLEVIKKRRIQTRNYYVSSANDEFTCGAISILVGPDMHKELNLGISKQQAKVSKRCVVHGYLGLVNGGS